MQSANQTHGVETTEFNLRGVLRLGYDVVHVHWPEVPLRIKRFPVRLIVSVAILCLLRLHKWIGRSRIVWTTHNLQPHERRDHWLTRWYFRSFLNMVDGTISLSEFGRQTLFEEHPRFRDLPSVVVHHGHYRDDYPTDLSRRSAREELGIPIDARVLSSLGMIRPYKNLPHLARLVHESDDANLHLLVAGPGKSPEDEKYLLQLAEKDARIHIDIGFIPSRQFAVYMAACDLVVLPYSDILNSGSLLLALSLDRPSLITNKGATAEIAEMVGDRWVIKFDGTLQSQQLEETLRRVLRQCEEESADGGQVSRPDLSEFEWSQSGRRTSDFFRSLTNRTTGTEHQP
ncbi:MAG: glycosyltransferase family 4 protein [Planctomycetota bacterium]